MYTDKIEALLAQTLLIESCTVSYCDLQAGTRLYCIVTGTKSAA